MSSQYEHDCGRGFDVACRWIGFGINWAFYIVLFPICYPLALLGRRERARIERGIEERQARHRQAVKMTTAEILAAARKK